MIRATITINRRVAIFIDAFTAVDNPRGIAWLLNEAELPAGVQVVVGGIRRMRSWRRRSSKIARC